MQLKNQRSLRTKQKKTSHENMQPALPVQAFKCKEGTKRQPALWHQEALAEEEEEDKPAEVRAQAPEAEPPRPRVQGVEADLQDPSPSALWTPRGSHLPEAGPGPSPRPLQGIQSSEIRSTAALVQNQFARGRAHIAWTSQVVMTLMQSHRANLVTRAEHHRGRRRS